MPRPKRVRLSAAPRSARAPKARGLYMQTTFLSVPKPRYLLGNEDAVATADDCIVCADGIGAWNEQNWRWDAGQVARTLAALCTLQPGTPHDRLRFAMSMLPKNKPGSATIGIAVLDRPARMVRILLVGDIRAVVVRNDTIVHDIAGQMRDAGNNVPVQVGVDAVPSIDDFESADFDAIPAHAFPVEPNDLVVLLSDGIDRVGPWKANTWDQEHVDWRTHIARNPINWLTSFRDTHRDVFLLDDTTMVQATMMEEDL